MKNMAYELLVPDPQDQMMVFRPSDFTSCRCCPFFLWVKGGDGGLERGEEVMVVPLVRRMRMQGHSSGALVVLLSVLGFRSSGAVSSRRAQQHKSTYFIGIYVLLLRLSLMQLQLLKQLLLLHLLLHCVGCGIGIAPCNKHSDDWRHHHHPPAIRQSSKSTRGLHLLPARILFHTADLWTLQRGFKFVRDNKMLYSKLKSLQYELLNMQLNIIRG